MTVSANDGITRHNVAVDWWPWLMVATGIAVLYLPSFISLFNGIWSTDQQGHGPIVLAISFWLLYRKWPSALAASAGDRASGLGWPLFVGAMLLYAIGRSQEILVFEIGSLIVVIISALLLMRGARAVTSLWFPLFFMIFMIPLPGAFVDAVTMPMKMAVSYFAEQVLYWFGYPIARTGVVLQIGPYQLLVADACAGLHTLFTLEALGLLYLNLIRHESILRNVFLAILIVPISFAANVIRVIVLTLVTYHLGDEAGQGFLHGFAGMVLFISALMLIIAADSMLRLWSEKFSSARHATVHAH